MKVRPAPKKRNITMRYDIASSFSHALSCRHKKKLRRLPHIFARVLELPFHSDADVLIEETADCFHFAVSADAVDIAGNIRAHSVEIHPGVTKVVIVGTDGLDLSMDELEHDLWRFRLPASTLPELATAAIAGGELVVKVPRDVKLVESDERLVLVQ